MYDDYDFIMEMLYQDLEEAIGEKGLAIIDKMHNDHRGLDLARLHGGYAKPTRLSKAVHAGLAVDRLSYNLSRQRDHNKELVHRLRQNVSDSSSDAVKKYSKQLASKYPMRYGKQLYDKANDKIARKNGLININPKGIEQDRRITIDPAEHGDKYKYGASQYHHEKNQRRMLAVRRLWDYIDKKGYDDESYAKKHAENAKRIEHARSKNRMRSRRNEFG
jgi:hypothetical protein